MWLPYKVETENYICERVNCLHCCCMWRRNVDSRKFINPDVCLSVPLFQFGLCLIGCRCFFMNKIGFHCIKFLSRFKIITMVQQETQTSYYIVHQEQIKLSNLSSLYLTGNSRWLQRSLHLFIWVPYDSCDEMTFCQNVLNQKKSRPCGTVDCEIASLGTHQLITYMGCSYMTYTSSTGVHSGH